MSADCKSNQAEPKRGRGRPRLPDALTPAQRSKRYRDNKRARQAAAPSAPSGQLQPIDGYTERMAEELLAENSRLATALEAARIRIHDLTGALEFFVGCEGEEQEDFGGTAERTSCSIGAWQASHRQSFPPTKKR